MRLALVQLFFAALFHLSLSKELKGRFLHITDLHPDPFYKPHASPNDGCHDHSSDSDLDSLEKKSYYWGRPITNCDTPLTFIDATFQWIAENWKDEVDFVVWTGDSARHDLDKSHPRTLDEIMDLNRDMSKRMKKAFGKVPIVPSVGNNDIWPHNVMWNGPNSVTQKLSEVWKSFIPEEQYHTFARGAYYAHEVVPGSIVVVALNTQYFYVSNKVVDGCPMTKKPKKREPGTEQLEWLEAQLDEWRSMGLQVYLTGHVPPSPGSWYEDCYQWYGELALSFQDTIIGHLFGHMNIDHFFWFDAYHVLYEDKKTSEVDVCSANMPTISKVSDKSDMVLDLHSYYKHLTEEKIHPKDFATVHVASSIIPKYSPGMRIWTYNATEFNDDGDSNRYDPEADYIEELDEEGDCCEDEFGEEDDNDNDNEYNEKLFKQQNPNDIFHINDADLDLLDTDDNLTCSIANITNVDIWKKKKKKHRRRDEKRGKHKKKRIPRHQSKHSPSRSNKYLTPLMYSQFYVDLKKANSNAANSKKPYPPPEWQVEYVTCDLETLTKHLERNHSHTIGPSPFPQRLSTKLEDSWKPEDLKKITPYDMPDLTIKSWLHVINEIVKNKKTWKAYVHRMFISSNSEETW